MKRFDKYYNENYAKISFYAIKTVLEIFILGLIIYFLTGKTGTAVTFVSGVLKPLVLGLALTYLLSPVLLKFETKLSASIKRPKTLRLVAVLLTFAVVLVVLFIILGIIVVTITKSLASFNIEDIKLLLLGLADQFSRFWTTIEKTLASMNINLGSAGDFLGGIFNGVKEGASTLLFATIFSVYFLYDDSIATYWSEVVDAFSSAETRAKIAAFAVDADRVFSGYIRGQSMDALLVGVVPYVGPVVGFGSLIIVSLAEGSISKLIIGAVILAAVMFIDGNVINPKMLSSNVEVHPVLVIVALIAGGNIGGVVGMLVAVPVAALLKLQFEKYVEKRKKTVQEREHEKKNIQGE